MPSRQCVLITGADGFIGRNLLAALRLDVDLELLQYDKSNPPGDLDNYLEAADVVFHLAGVNRPVREEEFYEGNSSLTGRVVDALLRRQKKPLLVITSSIQAALNNPYGKSKLLSEEHVVRYGAGGGRAVIYRLHNVFGKWSQPNYNSVVATFCYNIARGLAIQINDASRLVQLVYIDDVVHSFVHLLQEPFESGTHRQSVEPVYEMSLGDLAREIHSLHDIRTSLLLPDLSDRFRRLLAATYLSFQPEGEFGYALLKREDQRGSLAEFLKSSTAGQIFISRTKPGVTRGNHYHNTKVEKFLVAEGMAKISFREIGSKKVHSYMVKGEEYRVVDIPPGYTHSIQNVGQSELIVIFWASAPFDPINPDTFALSVEPPQP